jgi:hypothetical protein
MNYLKIKNNEERLTTLIKWLFDEVLASGEDGYGLWISKRYSAQEIYEFIIFNNLLPKGFKHRYDKEYDYYMFSAYQEQLTITNNNSFMDYLSSGIDVKLIY